MGGPAGGPLEVTLTRQVLNKRTVDLFRRCRLPLDQACWQAGVDLGELLTEFGERKKDLASRGVPKWKQETVTSADD